MNTKNAHERIDPELAEALKAVPMTEAGVFDLSDLEGTRVGVRAFAEAIAAQMPDEPSVSVEEVEVLRPDGSVLAIRLLRPTAEAGPLPVLLWFHGGGQVLGYAAQDDPTLKRLCLEVGCIAASVDYRLAPETPAPAAAEDGLLAYRWLRQQAAALGIDEARIALAGQSGGGGVAAATALMIRDQGEPAPLFQALSYPMLDDRNTTASSHVITDIGIWDRATNIHHLGRAAPPSSTGTVKARPASCRHCSPPPAPPSRRPSETASCCCSSMVSCPGESESRRGAQPSQPH